MMKAISLILLVTYNLFLPYHAYAQFGLSGAPHPSAALDVKATDKAFYPPRMSTAQRKAIVNPQPGAFVYDIDQGSFYFFDGQNWAALGAQPQSSLSPVSRTANDGMAGDWFGFSSSISGDYAIVGAFAADIGSNPDQGAAYIFTRNENGWVQQAKLTASDGEANDYFGRSVFIAGDYAIVGAYGDDVGGNSEQGSAYVFVRSGDSWIQQTKLTASDGIANDNFGRSVALSSSGDYALVGAALNDGFGVTQPGAAYIFVRSGSSWAQQAKLNADDQRPDSDFGFSVSLSSMGDYALVGAYLDNIGGQSNRGSTYVFIRSGNSWTQQAKLIASDGTAGNQFGYSVSLSSSGDYALIGARLKNTAYIYVRSGTSWTQQAIVTDGSSFNHFGQSVSLVASADYALVGGEGGAVTLFRRNGTTWTGIRRIATTENILFGYSVSISNGRFVIGAPAYDSLKGRAAFGLLDY
ncbi:FG-GAP repeat protein [Spirosoma gilvum]